uniref:Calponin-homology (CH) domain-containing protein n=1 Tax=Poecilia reticulata TaxID=8081 RepID=A0A3P9N727_POERE
RLHSHFNHNQNQNRTHRDLAEDAPWKKIQQNTFTRWINEHLKCVNKRIVDLQLDLGDGLRLIALLEVLSQKKMYRKYHPRPNFRQMKLENVSVALDRSDKTESISAWKCPDWCVSVKAFLQEAYHWLLVSTGFCSSLFGDVRLVTRCDSLENLGGSDLSQPALQD